MTQLITATSRCRRRTRITTALTVDSHRARHDHPLLIRKPHLEAIGRGSRDGGDLGCRASGPRGAFARGGGGAVSPRVGGDAAGSRPQVPELETWLRKQWIKLSASNQLPRPSPTA